MNSKQLILVLFTTFHLIIIVETASQNTDHDIPEQILSRIEEPDWGLRRFWRETRFPISGKFRHAGERTADKTSSEKSQINI